MCSDGGQPRRTCCPEAQIAGILDLQEAGSFPVDLEAAAYAPLIETSLVASARWAHQEWPPLTPLYKMQRSVSNPVAPGAFYSQGREAGTSGKGHGSCSLKPAAEAGREERCPASVHVSPLPGKAARVEQPLCRRWCRACPKLGRHLLGCLSWWPQGFAHSAVAVHQPWPLLPSPAGPV